MDHLEIYQKKYLPIHLEKLLYRLSATLLRSSIRVVLVFSIAGT